MIKIGKYQHFKGNYYEVLYLAKHSETEELLVVYRCEKDGSIWVRPFEMFFQKVMHNGELKDRFKYIS
ncbi:protein of unknown function DUF1653 [Desulforamulus reducens MI-1]|uniref:DUF1653 domain-containing protein n=1 Tax=Desulforamulus reducens (strain ATCC BAA-1160 / DSM 100696 / MI-1) TaxID=349161 RepID=A4J3W6_DESRM|nr:DUF1653 domain-containing protein [Desulforamulus reducens]ABO49769.1 protein of unknown function DUF1653 [Desulforamulus reducens MI-1]